MGLRTASVRRPYVEVMAPALTETSQNQTFQLSTSKDHLQPTSPIKTYDETIDNSCNSKYLPDVPGGAYYNNNKKTNTTLLVEEEQPSCDVHCNDDLKTLALLASDRCLSDLNRASASADTSSDIIMSDCPLQMGDQEDKMGLEKTTTTDTSVGKLHEKNTNEVDQFLNNLTPNDLPQNVEEWMQVINDRLADTPNDVEVDLPTNLTIDNTIDKLFNDVDMMNISMEEQQELDASKLKDIKSEDLIAEYKKRQAKIERRLDFLRRKFINSRRETWHDMSAARWQVFTSTYIVR